MFGLQHHYEADHVAIVEGALDAIWLDQCGIPTLALLGSKMGERKIRWLQHYRSVTLMPDYDRAGALWAMRVAEMIGTRLPLYVGGYRSWMIKKTPEKDGSYRRARDPEELRRIDAEVMYYSASNFIQWKQRLRNFIPPE